VDGPADDWHMLKLTKKADYGLIAMRHLAEHSNRGSCSAKDMADAHGIPPELLAKILQRLVKEGLLTSQHGINGGYTLARDPRMISVFDVIKAIEGPLFLTACVSARGECEQTTRCTVKGPLQRVSQTIEEVLSKLTIFEMTEPDRVPEELVSISS
jgi:Rrf2 family protein